MRLNYRRVEILVRIQSASVGQSVSSWSYRKYYFTYDKQSYLKENIKSNTPLLQEAA